MKVWTRAPVPETAWYWVRWRSGRNWAQSSPWAVMLHKGTQPHGDMERSVHPIPDAETLAERHVNDTKAKDS